MADTWETLKEFLRVDGTADDDFIQTCFDDATELVNDYVGDKFVPARKLELAIRRTGRDLYADRDAPQGVSQFSDANDTPIRVNRDPLTSAKPILRKYVTGIA